MDIKHRIKAEISEFMDLYWVCRMRYEASWPDAIYSIRRDSLFSEAPSLQ